jgi:hypothetical protein
MRSLPALPALLLLLSGCRAESPEAQVRRAFEEAVADVESGDGAKAAEALDAGFRGPEGMTRAEARLFLLGWLRQEKVGITVLAQRVDLRGPQAYQSVELLLTGKGAGRLLPEESSRRSLVLRWVRAGKAWRIKEIQTAGA